MGRWYKGDVLLDVDLIWKVSLNGKYHVSENGDVVNAVTGYRLKPVKSNCGYLAVNKICTKGGINGALHRVVYEAFVGEIPKGMQINHLDGVKDNNHISNLELCTPSENTKHAYRTGLATIRNGSEVGTSKVIESQIVEMYSLFKLGYTNKFIGDMYGLHDRYVSLIRHGRRWGHLFTEENMSETLSTGTLPFTLPKCIYIYNKCMSSTKPQEVLGKELGIDPSTVSRIRTGSTWKALRELYGIPKSSDWKEGNNTLIATS